MKRFAILKKNHGFSFVEVVVVLVILAIVSTVVIGRFDTRTADLATQTEIFKNHFRSAQNMAMAGANATDIYGIKCDANFYWLFKGTDPDTHIIGLFDDREYDVNTNNKLSLSAKKISIATAFTVFFDSRGIPYSAYTDGTSNTPLADDLLITIKPAGAASPVKTITITQHTGFIP